MGRRVVTGSGRTRKAVARARVPSVRMGEMETESFLRIGHRMANIVLFRVAGTDITVATLATAALIVILTLYLARLLDRAVVRALQARGVTREGSLVPARRLVRYIFLFLGFGVAINTMGIDIATLFTAGAIFAVGLGFAMQSIAQNFVSGVILLVERAVRPGDVVEVNGTFVRILEMGIRSTVARTRDDEELIIPNFTLAQSTVKNFTYTDSLYRLRSSVGVVYGSDMAKVKRVLQGVGEAIEWRVKEKAPMVLLSSFGDSAVIFELSVWMTDPWEARPALSRINEAIWWAFQEHGIVIAFPQLDVHLDEPALEALAGRLRKAKQPVTTS